MTRREWMVSSSALAAAQNLHGATLKNITIASANGMECCARVQEMLKSGADTLDAVVAGINIVELDPADTSVGYGGLPNEEGIVELDACVMHGPSRRAGSVAGIRNIKTPSVVAKLVMEQTDHIMLAGEGALRFAKAMGMKEENLLTEEARLAWIVWKQGLRDRRGKGNWGPGLDAPPGKPSADLRRLFPHADEKTLAWASQVAIYPPTGTINCLALNTRGEMSGCTTTSGLAWKIPGRIGDSPIIGAGLYVDQDVGAAGSTGRGEENIRVAGAHSVVEVMRQGKSPKDAVLEVLRRVARNYNNDLTRLEKFDLNFYALRKDGAYAAGSLWNRTFGADRSFTSRQFVINDGGKSRLEECVFLFERK